MSDIEKLADMLKKLQQDKALRNRIQFLERELKREPKEVVLSCGHEEHIDKLRARILDLEKENQRLEQKLEKVRAKTLLD